MLGNVKVKTLFLNGTKQFKLPKTNYSTLVWNTHKPFDPVTPQSPDACFIKGTKEEYNNELPLSFPVKVWKDFISPKEEEKLVQFLEPALMKKKYSISHFDSVICNFKEHLLSHKIILENEFLWSIVNKVKNEICAKDTELEDIHVLDIAENGYIAPHVDTNFTGGIVAGLTLLSDAVVTFQPHNTELQETLLNKKQENSSSENANKNTKLALNTTIVFPELPRIELLVPARSLYIITQEARYNWTHAIEVQENHKFNAEVVPRNRRISLMFRDEISHIPNAATQFGSLAEFA